MPFENGIPSHQTIGRVFSLFKPSTLEVAFIQFMADVAKKSPENIIALDGKTLRRSFDKAANTKPIHILNACAVESGLCLAQLMVESKTNEITAVPEMIDLLKSSGAIFTMDALNTQKSILEKVIKTGSPRLTVVSGLPK